MSWADAAVDPRPPVSTVVDSAGYAWSAAATAVGTMEAWQLAFLIGSNRI
jgi:hypothetical protein